MQRRRAREASLDRTAEFHPAIELWRVRSRAGTNACGGRLGEIPAEGVQSPVDSSDAFGERERCREIGRGRLVDQAFRIGSELEPVLFDKPQRQPERAAGKGDQSDAILRGNL